jgi:hypothetical protein
MMDKVQKLADSGCYIQFYLISDMFTRTNSCEFAFVFRAMYPIILITVKMQGEITYNLLNPDVFAHLQ